MLREAERDEVLGRGGGRYLAYVLPVGEPGVPAVEGAERHLPSEA
jgi:hypothetical protein